MATSTTSSRETTDPHSHTITTVTTTTVTQETTIRLSNRDRDRHGSLSLSVRGQGGHQGGHQHEPYSGGVGNGAYAPDLERIASERDFFEEKFNDEYTKDCELEMSDLKHESTKEDVPSSRPKEEQSLKKDRGLSLLRVSPKAWFVSRRRYARTWFLLAMILVSSVVVFGAVFVPLLVETSAFMDTLPTQTCSWVGYSSWIVRCSSGVAILLVMYTALKIRMLTDGYWIKGEFKLLAIFGTFIMLVTLATAAPEDSSTFNYQSFVRWFGFQACLAISLDYPIYLTFKHGHGQHQRKRLSSRTDSQASNQTAAAGGGGWNVPPLEQILLNDDYAALREDFKAHLVREFSIENYLFFNASYNFEYRKARSESDEHLARSAVKIYYEFIQDDSPSQVNVQFSERKAVEKALRKCILNFDELVKVCSSGGTSSGTGTGGGGSGASARGIPSFQGFDKQKPGLKRRNSVSVGGNTKLRLLTGQNAVVARHLYNTRLVLASRPPATVFAECRATVFQLLETNTFRRWKGQRNPPMSKGGDAVLATQV